MASPISPTPPNSPGDAAHIVDRGFQTYDGSRSGILGSIRSVTWQSLRATLGLGRLARHKVFPILSVLIAYVPAIVFVGIAVLLPESFVDNEAFVDYPDYYGYIAAAILLFMALAAPEILVGDRRNGMLALYLSTPLHRGTYLAAKALAVVGALSLVTLGPPLLLLIGRTFDGSGPDGFGNWLLVLLRIVVSAFAVSASLTGISMAAASLTDRRAFASVGVILLVIATPIVASALIEGAKWSTHWWLLDILGMAFELVARIFGAPGIYPEIDTVSVVAVNALWAVGGLLIVWWRYRRLVVAR